MVEKVFANIANEEIYAKIVEEGAFVIMENYEVNARIAKEEVFVNTIKRDMCVKSVVGRVFVFMEFKREGAFHAEENLYATIN